MAKTGGPGRGSGKGLRKKRSLAKAKPKPIGRPLRLAHLIPGSERQQRRERSVQASAIEAIPRRPPASVKLKNVLCLPNPEWLPQELTITGANEVLARFRAAASGPGIIPWVFDYDRAEEDWVLEMLTPPPSERGISVEGARILARQLRELVELQDMHVAEAALGSRACPLDLNALVPIPGRILGFGPNDPEALKWLWENWGTTWPLRSVEEITSAEKAEAEAEKTELRYRFWSADWTPWRVLSSIKSRWPDIMFQIAVRAVSE